MASNKYDSPILKVRSEAYKSTKSGTWDMKSEKDYDRKKLKREDKKEFDKYK
jgi:hypothetical protein